MSTAFGLNLFLLSHLWVSWWRSAEPSWGRGPCCSAGLELQGGAELLWRRKGARGCVLAEGHCWGRGEIGVQGCKAPVGSAGTRGTRVIHRVLVSGLCGKQPVALDNTCGIKLECELGFVPAWIHGLAFPHLLCSCWTLQYTLATVELPSHVFPWGQ